jgi:hypothetical protein
VRDGKAQRPSIEIFLVDDTARLVDATSNVMD